jgi:hypothetical protein
MRGDTREAKEEAKEGVKGDFVRTLPHFSDTNRGRRQAEAALCGYRIEEVPMRTDVILSLRGFIVVTPDGQRYGQWSGHFPTEAAAWDAAWWLLQGALRDE